MEEIGNNLGVSKSLISTWCKTWNIKTNNEYKKTCRLCGMTYKSFHNRSMFCSESCRTKYRYKHLGEDIKNKLRLEGSIRSRKSNETQTYEQKKIKWDKANKKKSERYFGEKYRTLNQEEIKVIKQTSAKAKYIARMNTPYMRMKGSLYRRLNHLIKGYSKDAHMQDYLGCSFRFLKEYLGNKFLDNMTWDNYGKGGWVIDHIIPCCNFDLSKEADRYKCFNYKNLQPLWEKDNTRKGGKMPDGTFIYSRENFRIKNNSLIEAQSRGVKYE